LVERRLERVLGYGQFEELAAKVEEAQAEAAQAQ
jgi:hypothetical protein